MKQTNIRDMKIVAVLALLVNAYVAATAAWGTHRWVGEFFEFFVAGIFLGIQVMGIPIGAGIAGYYIAQHWGRNWLGWVAGILLCMVLWYFLPDIFEQIPGVGEKLRGEMPSYW